MDEFLKTVRGIHRLLLILCLTIIAFVLTSKPNTSTLEAALTDVQALHKLKRDLKTYHDKLEAHVKSLFDNYILANPGSIETGNYDEARAKLIQQNKAIVD